MPRPKRAAAVRPRYGGDLSQRVLARPFCPWGYYLGLGTTLVLLALGPPQAICYRRCYGEVFVKSCRSTLLGIPGLLRKLLFERDWASPASSGNPFALAKRAVLGWDRTSLRDGGYPATGQSRSQGRLAQHGNHHLVLRQS